MKEQELKSSILLLLAAAIWGFAFVAQRVGAKYVGAFTFNGVRFALGCLSIIPLLLSSKRKTQTDKAAKNDNLNNLSAGVIIGCVLFLAASLQQIGLNYTAAGKAAFITGFYIVLVPVFGLFLKHRTHMSTWVAVIFAITGLYLLSVTSNFTIEKGDLFELAGAFLWTIHLLLIDSYTKRIHPLELSLLQFATCSALSLIVAVFFETITLSGLVQATVPILYGGICSVGVAYTLQAVGQKHAKPAHAAIVLSMESVFAGIGGLLILKENLGGRGYLGCALMLTGMLITQMPGLFRTKER